MGENVQHKNRPGPIVNSRNQPKLIAGDIEHRSASNLIGAGINLLHVSQRIPVSPPHGVVPAFQAGARIRMPAKELHYGLSADDPHEKRCSQKENYLSMASWLSSKTPSALQALKLSADETIFQRGSQCQGLGTRQRFAIS